MAKGKKGTRKQLVTGDHHAPDDMRPMMAKYVEWLRTRNYSERTVEGAEYYLDLFATWTEQRGIIKPQEVSRQVVERYQRHSFYYRKANGRPLGISSQRLRLIEVRGFFGWLTRQRLILFNPASDIELPRGEQHLPAVILTPAEAERVIAQPDTSTPLGIRDRAMLEILYSTGMRRMELADRTVYSVQPERRTVMIRRGKGAKDRIVPIGDRALYWYGRYLEEVRPKLVVEPDPETLFLSARGAAMSLIDLSQIIGGYVRAAGVSKIGACHLFRHCVATAMLNNGADIRFIQEMLGHTRLETTQRYTHVSIEKLKQVHAQTHPTSRPARDQTEAGETELTREELLEELLSDDEKGEGEE